MPVRTNEFQTVVSLIQKHLAGPAKVTESHELIDASTGKPREVDITIEVVVAGHPVMISLECRSYKRKQTVAFVEEMHGKHLFLPTNSLVLVSSSGFTAEAIARAAVHGIELITPNELTDDKAGEIVNRLQSIWFKTLNTQVTGVRVHMAGSEYVEPGWYDVGPEIGVFFADGTEAANLLMLANGILRSGDWRPAMRDALEDVTHFTAGADPLRGKKDGAYTSLYLQQNDPITHLVEIEAIEMIGTAKVQVAEFPLLHREFNGTPYSYGRSKVGDLDALMVVTEGEDSEGALSIRFG